MEPEPSFDLEAEIELLRQIGKGNQQSFARFYDTFSGVLFSAAYRILNNQQAAEDVLQDVFLQIWDKAPMYDPARGKPLTWALTMTRNKSIDRLRSTQRRNRLGDALESEAQAAEQFDDKSSVEVVEASEQAALVREAIRRLSKEQREAIELAFFSGLTQTEIAERLDEPLGTIKARIRRGMLRLRELLDSSK